MEATIIWVVAAAVIALIAGYMVAASRSKSNARSQANIIIDEAKREGEVIKEKKLLEAKEQELKIKNEAERQANQKLQKIQAGEARVKQKEMQLSQQQSELSKRKNELDNQRNNLDKDHQALAAREAEIDRMQHQAQETLEHISGLSADEARERLIESLKDEAKTAAASYINDIMDDARMTASKEAKRIVVQSIQRVATETAVETA